jgi:hypothetical protein
LHLISEKYLHPGIISNSFIIIFIFIKFSQGRYLIRYKYFHQIMPRQLALHLTLKQRTLEAQYPTLPNPWTINDFPLIPGYDTPKIL